MRDKLLLGYFEFAILLFLPGLATLLLFNQVKESSLLSVLARSYGISLALNALGVFAGIVLARNPSVHFLLAAAGISLRTAPPVILVGSLGIVLLLGARRYWSQLVAIKSLKISKAQVAALLFGIISASLILSQFVKYPVFPKSFSVDFIQHVILLKDILYSHSDPLAGIFYYGVHYNLALGSSLVGGDTFVQIQYLMGILVAPSSLVVYEATRRIYMNERFALLGQFLFIATGFLWYVPLYNTGLYPNLFAILVSLAFLTELRNAIDGQGIGRLITLALVTLGLYLSHYFSGIFIIAAVLSLLLLGGVKILGWKPLVAPVVITLAPLLFLLFRPDLLNAAQQIYTQPGPSGFFTFSTPLADIFSFNSFLRYSIAVIFNYGSLVILFGLPLAIFYAWRHRTDSWPIFILPLWFALMWILAPTGEVAWRFAFEGLAPLILLIPGTFSVAPRVARWILRINPGRERKERKFRKRGYSALDIITVIILLLVTFGGSWTSIMMGDLTSNVGSYSRAQTDLYDSMYWFAQNTPPRSSLLSVTDWRIAFLEPITGRAGQLLFLAPGPETVAYAKSNNYDYVLVTYLIPAKVPPTLDLETYYGSFSQNQSLKIVYNNGNDIIYQVLK